MNRIMLALIGVLIVASEPVFAHGGTHPTPPAPPPPGSTTPPPVVPPPVTPPPPVTQPPATTPAPSYIVVPPRSSTGNYTVYWGPVAGVTSYELEEDILPTFANQWRYTIPSTFTAVRLTGRTNGSWYYRVRAVINGAVSIWTTGANPCVVFLQGTLTLSMGSASPSYSYTYPGGTTVVMQLGLVADPVESINMQALTFGASGTMDDMNGVAAVMLFLDTNRNGTLELGTDSQIGGSTYFSGNDGSASIQPLARTIPGGGSESWLLVLQLSASAVPYTNFRASVRFTGDVAAQGASTGITPIIVGLPIFSGQMTVTGLPGTGAPAPAPPQTVGSLKVSAGPANPGNRDIARGSEGNVVMQIALEAGAGERIRIDTLVLNYFGTLSDPSGLMTFSLHADSNDNGELDRDDVLIRGPMPMLPACPTILFLALGQELAATQRVAWLVTANVSNDVPVGSTMGVNLEGTQCVSVKGAISQSSVPISGPPILGPEMTVVEAEAAPSASRGGCGAVPAGAAPAPGVLGAVRLVLGFLAVRRAAVRSR